MRLYIKHQENYSRAELILRSFFGWIYILIPHMFLLLFASIWAVILIFLAFWIVLFTGKYPRKFFDFQAELLDWNNRLNARFFNLTDGYPPFGMEAKDDYTSLEIPYPENLSRGLLVIRLLFGWLYVGIPHGFILYFRVLATLILTFLAFWVVLFTGNYPASWHEFNVGTLRWSLRVNLYLYFMTDEYPPFHGNEMLEESFEKRDN